MYYRVKHLGQISNESHAFLIERERIVSKLYVMFTRKSILVYGYPFRVGLSQLYIKYNSPTVQDVEELLSLHPIELLNRYRPKIKIIVEFPPLKKYKKLYTFGEMRFAVYEYDDGYIVIDSTTPRIGVGKIPFFNDDIFDILRILRITKPIPHEVAIAIDSIGKITALNTLI